MSEFTFTERNLILTGYIGPEQMALGRRIARQLNMPYANVEMTIADRLDLPVDDIRTYFGETRLKSIEAEIVQEMALRRQAVIGVSGRSLLHGDNLARLASTGPVICLTISLNAMLHRMHVNMGARYHDPAERALELGEIKREWAVRHMPGIHEIDVTRMDALQIVDAVIALWREQAIERQ